jgi:hypothetical protein
MLALRANAAQRSTAASQKLEAIQSSSNIAPTVDSTV